jgi:hypothetical protein
MVALLYVLTDSTVAAITLEAQSAAVLHQKSRRAAGKLLDSKLSSHVQSDCSLLHTHTPLYVASILPLIGRADLIVDLHQNNISSHYSCSVQQKPGMLSAIS